MEAKKIIESTLIDSIEQYNSKMTDFEESIKAMLTKDENGFWRCPLFIFSGEKGVGKSYVAEKVFKNQDVRSFDDDNIIKKSTPFELYKQMWKRPDDIYILDDDNEFFNGKAGVDLLKSATEKLDQNKTARVMQWVKYNAMCVDVGGYRCRTNEEVRKCMDSIVARSDNPKLKAGHAIGKTFPNKFFFTGNIIILTNLPLRRFTTGVNSALGNRGEHLEIHFSLKGAMDLIRHSEDKVPGEKPETIRKAIDFLTSDDSFDYCSKTNKMPTIRSLQKVTNKIHSGHALDESLLDMCLEYAMNE